MISVTIQDIPKFMSILFSSEGLDKLYLSEGVIKTFSTFNIDGHTNKDFYNEDSYNKDLNDDSVALEPFTRWEALRPLCRELIKGKRIPVSMKFSFILPDETKDRLLSVAAYNGSFSEIHFVYNVMFEGNSLRIISATSTDTFLFNKDYEVACDAYLKVMLTSLGISFDEE